MPSGVDRKAPQQQDHPGSSQEWEAAQDPAESRQNLRRVRCCGAETDPWLRIVLEKLVAHYKRHEDIAEAPAGLAAGECPTVPFFTVELDFTLARV